MANCNCGAFGSQHKDWCLSILVPSKTDLSESIFIQPKFSCGEKVTIPVTNIDAIIVGPIEWSGLHKEYKYTLEESSGKTGWC